MHESFHKDDATRYSRPWFAWQNTLFGELVLKLIDDGKLELLNKAHKSLLFTICESFTLVTR